MRTILAAGAAIIVCLLTLHGLNAEPQSGARSDADILRPWLHVDGRERDKLAQRGVVVRSLPAVDRQIGVIAACAVAVSPDAFVSRVGAAGDLRRGTLSGRFSNPPSLADLSALTLDQGDIDRLRFCRTGDCRLNFADREIASMRHALRDSASGPSPAAQAAFRQVVLDRVNSYRSAGLQALPDYHDRAEPVRPAAVFADILRQIQSLTRHAPAAATYLERFPATDVQAAESSLLWTKVTMNDKPVVMVTHVAVFRPVGAAAGIPNVLVARKQVYACLPPRCQSLPTRRARGNVQRHEARGDRRPGERGGGAGARRVEGRSRAKPLSA
jgi:hypothetical protein